MVDEAEDSGEVRHPHRGRRTRRGGDHGPHVPRVRRGSGRRVRGLLLHMPFPRSPRAPMSFHAGRLASGAPTLPLEVTQTMSSSDGGHGMDVRDKLQIFAARGWRKKRVARR